MTRTVLRTTLLIAFAATSIAGPAQARGFGGGGFHGSGFAGRGIARGEPNPGIPNGGFHHGGGWGHHGYGWGFGTIGFAPYGFCVTKRFIDPFGNLVLRRVCD